LQADMQLTARHLQLKELFPTAESMRASLGEINGSAKLTASGNSIADLLAGADGEMGLFMDRATISKFLLEAAGLNIANVVITQLFGDRQVQLNCAVADFTIVKGLMTTEAFIVDTEDALIDVSGNIHLGEENLDLKVKPQTKGLRILSLRTPLYVKGSFKDPDINFDKGVLAMRGGGAIALGAVAWSAALVPLIATGRDELRQDNGCLALLAHSRDAVGAQTSAPVP
ncbi:MAG: AsmA family protein, partial [Spongiibacteraceae bacterium]